MKKKHGSGVWTYNTLKKTFRIMRLVLFLLLISIFQTIASAGYSQNAKITLKSEALSLVDILRVIEDQSEYRFIYDKSQIDLDKKVKVNFDGATVKSVLEELFVNQGVNYRVIDNQIILTNSASSVSQQPKTISGRVTDPSGAGLPGVTVMVKGTTNGIITDTNGNYSLRDVPSDATLVFSFVGMKQQEIPVSDKAIINVNMVEETIGIEEVVAIGYGTMKKSDLTGSVASVKGDILNSIAKVNVQSALQGRVAGVQINQSSGMPGSTMQIRIRGTNSIKGGNEPLYIIDGFPGDPAALNVSDVESIEVLKDASASAIYGSRAANGVLLITTKQAKPGNMSVEYNGSLGFASQIKKLDLMTASEYLQFMNEQQKIATGNNFYTAEQIAAAGKGTDWQDLVFRTAKVNNHSINISGGNDMIQALLGFSYYDQEGIIPANEIQKYSMRANISMKLSEKVKVSGNLLYMYSDWDRNDSSGTNRLASVIGSVLGAPATIKPYNEDGSYSLMTTDFLTSGLNPIAYINEVKRKQLDYRLSGNGAIDYKPIKDLTLRISGNVIVSDGRNENYTTTKYPGSQGAASLSFPQTVTLNNTNTLTYDKIFNTNHHLTALLGMTYDQSVSKSASMSAEKFQSDAGGVFNIGAGSQQNVPSTGYSKWTMLSFLGRLNYSFQSKYLATFNMRVDGSSRYSKGGKWGYFPSGALAWRMSEEKFMKNLPVISDWKWRVGYGVTGNTAISPYQTLDLIGTGTIVLDKALVTYYRMSDTFQSDLKWETTRQLNLGIDLALFDNRLRVTADYYLKKTNDLLNTVEMPRSSGFTTSTRNIGKMENKGFELQIDADIMKRQVEWNVTANVSFNRNKVTELYEGADMYGATQDIVIMKDIVHLIREGEPLGVFYGYMEDGYDDQGRVQYKDLDPDGSITALDRQVIGNPYPDCTLGFTSAWKYKNFQLSCFLYASIGNDIYSLSMAALTHDYQWGISTMREVLYDHWTPENPTAKYPNITAAASGNLRMSDRFVYDGSYMRMKNLEFAYNLPARKLGLQKAQVYVSGQNLFTITKYPFWDVEVNALGGSSSVEQGIDAYNYPGNKSYTLGVRIVF
ncbi:MAG: SusC/RagA family TonB-linked outer membrane protein [Mangrovibacterium sp.]